MWAVKPPTSQSSVYNTVPGYGRSSRTIPFATNPPPLHSLEPPQVRREFQPPAGPAPRSSKRAAPSPVYAVTPGYDAGQRRIPTAAPPMRGAGSPGSNPMPNQARKPGGRAITPAPPSMPPPRHMRASQAHQPPSVPIWRDQGPQSDELWAEPEPNLSPDPPFRLSLAPNAGFVSEGLSTEAPAIYADSRLANISCSATHILQELLEDPSSEVVLADDPQWEEYPEVGDALLRAGGGESSMCIAVCHELGAWGVGCGKAKKRETLAKLALCVALVGMHEDPSAIYEKYPEFAQYCEVQQPSKKKRKKMAKAVAKKAAGPQRAMEEPTQWEAPAMDSESVPKDVPLWIKLPGDELLPEQLDGLRPEGLALSTAGTGRKGLYANIDSVLASVVAEPAEMIELIDDHDWSVFPTIGQALKEISDKEECLCVAVCASHSCWAVGVGNKSTNRFKAAKAALAATLLWQMMEAGEELPEMESQAMLEFVGEVQQTREQMGW